MSNISRTGVPYVLVFVVFFPVKYAPNSALACASQYIASRLSVVANECVIVLLGEATFLTTPPSLLQGP